MSALSPSQGTPMSVPRPCPAPTDKEGDDALLGIKGAPGLAAHLLTLLRQAAHLGVGLGRGNENTPPPHSSHPHAASSPSTETLRTPTLITPLGTALLHSPVGAETPTLITPTTPCAPWQG